MKPKLLFMTFVPITEGDGISYKIESQAESLRKAAFDVHLSKTRFSDSSIYYMIDDRVISTYKNTKLGKLRLYLSSFHTIYMECLRNNYNVVYIRHFLFSSYPFLNFIKQLDKAGIRVYLEIPTYPYDGERNKDSIISKLRACSDNLFRKKLYPYLKKIITFSSDSHIWNCDTINISNAVDPKRLCLKKVADLDKELHIVGVAVLAKWHGFDRVLDGISNYNKDNPEYKIIFHICGMDPSQICYNELQSQVVKLGIQDNVVFHGMLSGKELNNIFDMSHVAIGSLGRHRNGIEMMRSLKNVEYATRGIPFVYSEQNPDFDFKPFVYKVRPDESPLNMGDIIAFYNSLKVTPLQIRDFASEFSWDNQMAKVAREIKKEIKIEK